MRRLASFDVMACAVTGRGIVVDIEGTTSATDAVHSGLYNYARPRLAPWIDDHRDDPEVAAAVAATIEEADLEAEAPTEAVVAALLAWMDADVKATPLKTLQGQIWAAGFDAGELVPQFFDDVAPALRHWADQGLPVAVFSSGSVAVQRPWFRTGLAGSGEIVSAFFDTVNAGPKRQPTSYRAIATDLAARWGVDAGALVFLSDVPEELTAARDAGWQTVGVRRPGEPNAGVDFGTHCVIESFADLDVALPRSAPCGAGEVLAAGARLAATAQLLAAKEWMEGTSGNLSEVVSRHPLRLAVTASGIDKGALDASDVVCVDETGRAVDVAGFPAARPSAEAGLHARIAGLTGAGAVIHVHARAPVIAAERWPAGPVLAEVEMLKGIGRDADDSVLVPVIANSQDMRELGDRFAHAYDPTVPAVIVARHGMYVWGDDVTQARHRTECLEWMLSFLLATEPNPQHDTKTDRRPAPAGERRTA